MKPRLIGRGSEGAVYKIAPNLVKKIWRVNLMDEQTRDESAEELYASICRRLRREQKKAKRLPKLFRVPEFAGSEIVRGRVVTYHEYIKPVDLPKHMDMAYLEKIDDQLASYCSDAQVVYGYRQKHKGTNTIWSGDKFYLVDAMLS
jgi:hypothetical protein